MHTANAATVRKLACEPVDMALLDKLELNKIAARWPAKAVAQFSTSSKKTVDIYLHKKYC